MTARDRDDRGQHQLQAGPDRPAPNRAHPAGGHAARSGRQRRRSGRQHHHLRRDVVRQPLPGQRRDRQREPARTAAQPVHRGRHPGDDRPHRRHLGRVRALHRRRRQHAHQVGRQRVQRAASAAASPTRAGRRRRRSRPSRKTRSTRSTRPRSAGPFWRDRLWFFTAGRYAKTERHPSDRARRWPATGDQDANGDPDPGRHTADADHLPARDGRDAAGG